MFTGCYFNPRSPHGERPYVLRSTARRSPHFNPRSPHGERRVGGDATEEEEGFQPTLPARGATSSLCCSFHRLKYFNPRSPHGERQYVTRDELNTLTFQPTLPARGATLRMGSSTTFAPISTHAPRTGSDVKVSFAQPNKRISTHAPRTGSDRFVAEHPCPVHDFNPRSPHGERRENASDLEVAQEFQPTLPARGATRTHAHRLCTMHISTHAPRTGSDHSVATAAVLGGISTHAPRTGSDRK